MTNTDVIIIGAGPGGYRAAGHAAASGLQVVIIEGADVGGTCLNEGCIPTKTFAHTAELMQVLKESEQLGLRRLHYDFDFRQVVARKDEVLAQLRSGIKALLSHPNTTGSVAKTLHLKEPVSRPILDSSDLLRLDHLPKSLCIIGAGVIGMEFASIFSAFGTQVTVIEYLKECLPALDSDIAKRLRKTLEKRGVTFCMQCGVTAITNEGVTFQNKKGKEETIQADEVLMAVGRAPRVSDDFQLAGFDYYARTGIKVDDHMQTTVPGIYAIGDVNGRQMLAHAAEAQAKVAVRHILHSRNAETDSPLFTPFPSEARLPVAFYSSLSPIPAAIFTYPEAAGVGLTEDQLKAEGTAYECRKAFHRANGKALTMNETEGMLKLLSEPGAGRIIGGHAFGTHAADMIQEVSVLMCRKTTIAQLRDMIHIHPTLSEIVLAAAES